MHCALSWPYSSPNDPKNATPTLKAGGYGAMPSGDEAAEGGGGAPHSHPVATMLRPRMGPVVGESWAQHPNLETGCTVCTAPYRCPRCFAHPNVPEECDLARPSSPAGRVRRSARHDSVDSG